jgi:hypothetical protein
MPGDPHLPESVHGQPCVIVGGVYAGDPDKGMNVLQPLRELGTPLADISQPMPFTVVQSAFDEFFPRGQLQAYWKSTYFTELADDAIEVMAERAQGRTPGSSEFELVFFDLYPMGGAVNRVDPAATAFSERSAAYLLAIDANWTDPADSAANVAWVRDAWGELDGKFGTGSTYLNFSGRDDERLDVGVEDALAGNLRRLAEVKATYDPDNFFRRDNNVAPAGGA